jgi:hypothetical protein
LHICFQEKCIEGCYVDSAKTNDDGVGFTEIGLLSVKNDELYTRVIWKVTLCFTPYLLCF